MEDSNFPEHFSSSKFSKFAAPEYYVEDTSDPYTSILLPPFRYSHGSKVGGNNLSCNVNAVNSVEENSDSNVVLLIGIISALPNASRRSTIRRTWLKKATDEIGANNIEYVFILGLPPSLTIPHHIITEMNTHHDILLLPLVDTYSGMIHKVLSLFSFSQKQCSAFYTLRSNDDVYLRLEDVFDTLKSVQPVGVYAGYFLNSVKVRE